MAKYRLTKQGGYSGVYHLEKKFLWWWTYVASVGDYELAEVKKRVVTTGTHLTTDTVVWGHDTKSGKRADSCQD